MVGWFNQYTIIKQMSSVLFFENPTRLFHDAYGAQPALDLIGGGNLGDCHEHLHEFAMGVMANQEWQEKG